MHCREPAQERLPAKEIARMSRHSAGDRRSPLIAPGFHTGKAISTAPGNALDGGQTAALATAPDRLVTILLRTTP